VVQLKQQTNKQTNKQQTETVNIQLANTAVDRVVWCRVGHDVGNVEAIPTMSRVVFSEMKTRTLQMIDSASPSIPTQLRAAADVVPSALAVDRITG